MTKTHKLSVTHTDSMPISEYKILPIVTGLCDPTGQISWFFNKIVSHLLLNVPSILSNTIQFLEHFHNTNFGTERVMESFDVEALYTNAPMGDALQAPHEMLELHGREREMYGLSRARIMTIVKERLNCNVFKWPGGYFSENRELVLGKRLVPVLAICFTSRVEQPVLARLPLLYCRHIDDCFLINSIRNG
ncbi:hypothetical protein Y032_0780g2296 [Ancylostoma ceylanicum]|uniref:Reverse transcriptase domain-containing protein n=1 Tax=Ancylostoma ceylanicum TaxID=53326 RepID=A0A016WE85_9BILA|nr:hypothetical protein Y032_0780g2296 [Ancylostoma ceylanicum]